MEAPFLYNCSFNDIVIMVTFPAADVETLMRVHWKSVTVIWKKCSEQQGEKYLHFSLKEVFLICFQLHVKGWFKPWRTGRLKAVLMSIFRTFPLSIPISH